MPLSEPLAATVAANPRVLVALSSPWCAPCRALEAALAQELPNHPELTAVHVDISTDPASAQALGVLSTPTLVGFVDGRPVHRAVGFSGRSGLGRFLEQLGR